MCCFQPISLWSLVAAGIENECIFFHLNIQYLWKRKEHTENKNLASKDGVERTCFKRTCDCLLRQKIVNPTFLVLGCSLPTLSRESYPEIYLEGEHKNTQITYWVWIREKKRMVEVIPS